MKRAGRRTSRTGRAVEGGDAVKSRRRFLKLVALTSAAALVPATPRRTRAATAPKKSAPAAAARPAALENEIKKQKNATAQALKAIRDFELPPGSEMAFVFSAQRAPRRGKPGSSKGGKP